MAITVSVLGDLFSVELSDDGQREQHRTLPPEHFDVAVSLLAERIVERRLAASERLREVWVAQRIDPCSEVADERDRQLLVAHLCENLGTPTAKAPPLHLRGLVAEALWLEVVADIDEGLGVPVRIEGHDWSATDPGGDGLTVYAATDGEYPFRLWETKHHTASSQVRKTVNRACRQVRARSTSYLARFSLIAQQITDNEDLAASYGRLTERWVDRDPTVGVGICVGTSTSSDTTDCFGKLQTYFGLPADRHHGHLHLFDDFASFARAVRNEIWKGCGFWIEP